MRRRLRVTPIPGEILRFLVESQRGPDVPEYLVDLGGCDGNSSCSCENFEYRIFPLVKNQLHLNWQERRPIACIHIHEAREYFLQEIIHHLNERLNQPPTPAIFGKGELPKDQKENWQDFWFQKFFHWRGRDEKK